LRDLSLHILDLIENSIRARASVIVVTISLDAGSDLLEVTVDDNGPGLSVPPEKALDPFYTTKKGKKTGLGLSLFKAAAERADGSLCLSRSSLGGLCAKAVMKMSHCDRAPLGDLAATISSVVCTNPDIDLTCRIRVGDGKYSVRASDVVQEFPTSERFGLNVARQISERMRKGLRELEERNIVSTGGIGGSSEE
jgi:hypothetical protein